MSAFPTAHPNISLGMLVPTSSALLKVAYISSHAALMAVMFHYVAINRFFNMSTFPWNSGSEGTPDRNIVLPGCVGLVRGWFPRRRSRGGVPIRDEGLARMRDL